MTLPIKLGGTGVTSLPALRTLLGQSSSSTGEIRLTSDDLPQDYETDARPILQAKINEAQALGKRLILPDTGNRYISLNAPLVCNPGAQRVGVSTGAVLTDSSNVPLKNNVRIEGNGNTIVGRFPGFALDCFPTMTLAELAANPSWYGYDSAQLDIQNLNFNLNGAPGAQALRVGRQGRSFHDLTFYSQIHGISANSIGGDNTAPADHAVRFEGYLYAIEMNGWRLNAVGAGLWMVIDSTTPGCFQGAFFFKDFQSLGRNNIAPLRVSVFAGATGARSEIRGLHFQDCQIYGGGTAFEAIGNANIGDIWFHPGCQWDGPMGGQPYPNEPAFKVSATQGGKIFNNFWIAPYIQYYNGPAVRFSTDSNGTSMISNQQFRGGSVTLIDNSTGGGGGIFDMQGTHSGGLVLEGIDFQGVKGAAYVAANGADSVSICNCTSNGETVGESSIVNCIATAGSISRLTATGNLLHASNTATVVSGPHASAHLETNNLVY